MTSDKTFPIKGDGLSAMAVEKTDAVRKLLTEKDFLQSSQELSKQYFDRTWSIDPDSETEMGPAPLDVTVHRDKTVF